MIQKATKEELLAKAEKRAEDAISLCPFVRKIFNCVKYGEIGKIE